MKMSRSQLPVVLSSENLEPKFPDSDIQDRGRDRRTQAQRRKIKNPSFFGSNGVRLKKDKVSVGKRSGPATPLLRWKFDDADLSVPNDKEPEPEPEPARKSRRERRNAEDIPVSARNLAAALWQLQLPEVTGGAGDRRGHHKKSSDRLEPHVNHMGVPFLSTLNSREYGAETTDLLESPLSVSGSTNGVLYKVDTSLPFANSAMEGATKWDPGKTSDEVYQFYGRKKLLEAQPVTTIPVVSALQVELEEARCRIHELEIERLSSKKKFKHFLRKLADERASWRSREHEKIRAVIDDVKDDLNRDRKNRQRLEIVNSKLVNELAEAKLSAKRFMQDYEKEKKVRELMEEVCDELAKEIGEDKAEVESLKRETMKIYEELDEERKMLQMAEVWREERVQMKLVDAKLTLDEKYSQLSNLIVDLEAFLRSRTATPDLTELREAELLRGAASSVQIHDIREFSYEPPNSEDIFSVFEDLQPGEDNKREIVPHAGYSPVSRASKVHTVNPDVNGFNKNQTYRYSNGFIDPLKNGFIDQNRAIEEHGSGWVIPSHAEDQASSYSPESSDPSVNRNCQDMNVSGSVTEWESDAGHDTETIEACHVSSRHSKVSSWKSNSENYNILTVEGIKERISNGRLSNGGIISLDQRSGGDRLSPQNLLGHWTSPDSGNPHMTRGLKGCIEWPRGILKNSLKAKLLEARMESQKIQLRHVLKQKI